MRRALAWAPIAVLGALSLCGTIAFAKRAQPASVRVVHAVKSSGTSVSQVSAPRSSTLPAAPSSFDALPAIAFENQNTGERANIRLYDSDGSLNQDAAAELDRILCDARNPKERVSVTIDRRTLQLAVRAALHFKVYEIVVVSGYRKPGKRSEGPHAAGRAVDFKLPGVPARTLAAYLRTLPRVGVGVYTHPRTSFVHLDDREHSFHWLDASPPGRTWREQSIGNSSLPKRDAAYRRADDWPEGTSPPDDANSR